MAYWIDESSIIRGSSNQTAFMADTDADISKLPTTSTPGMQQGEDTISCKPVGQGSSCFVIDSSKVYMLKSTDEWKAI